MGSKAWTYMLLLCVVAGVGCTHKRGAVSLASNDPALKLPAMRKAVEADRSKDLSALVEALEDDDVAIRMFAISSLRRITGETLGYRYYDDDLQRTEAVNRWREKVGMAPSTRPTRQSRERVAGAMP